MDILLQQIINGLVLGSMYALVALGYTMVYGIINLINFAHGEVLMVGAMVSWAVLGPMQQAWPSAPGWLLMLGSFVLACGVTASLNFAIEKLAYKPLRSAPRLAPLITAIGVSILLQTLAMIIFKPNYKPYPAMLPAEPFEWAGAVITPTQVAILGLTALTLALLMWLVHVTPLGRAMRATAENPQVASLMGVRPDWVISATSDRMGYRLEGPPLTHARSPNIVSDGIANGSLQIPGNGQPLLLLADRGTTGGYPKIATVITADLGRAWMHMFDVLTALGEFLTPEFVHRYL